MARIICDLTQIHNKGEEVFYNILDKFLDDSHIVYWNREVYGREFDFCILIPGIGIAVVEVKGWSESVVLSVPDGQCIRIRTEYGDEDKNPRAQARAYRFAVLNHIRVKLGKQPVVFHMVCYPFISSDFYESKHMDLVSEPQLTFLAEDLTSQEGFLSKMGQAISLSRDWGTDTFTPLLMRQVRLLFEPDIEPEILDSPQSVRLEIQDKLLPYYSIFSYLPEAVSDWRERIDLLIQAYSQGIRIYSIVGTTEMLVYALECLSELLEIKGLRYDKKGNLQLGVVDSSSPSFGLNPSTFNWSIVHVQSDLLQDIPDLHIVDGYGVHESNTRIWLNRLDQVGGLNLGQYLVEHAKPRSNVLVKAGAGTGKTYSMILRVAYLCYVENISPANLADAILMITFTNDAAENMKKRLKNWFRNYYLLTGRSDFLEMMVQVENMQISTIHSYTRKTIERFGPYAGYGNNLKVVSGKYWRRQILEEALERYVMEQLYRDPLYIDRLGLPIYEVREILLSFVERLENKSVDVTQLRREQFGDAPDNQPLHDLIRDVITSSEREFDSQLLDNNSVFLGRLMPTLARLVRMYPERLKEGLANGSRYLFIDEFQDTDDVQIEVIRRICSLVGYWLFVVGDVKQCIYRFRGAEEKAFDHLEIKNDSDDWEQHSLYKNFRTDKRLLAKYQEVFTLWGQPPQHLLTYTPSEDALVSDLAFHLEDIPIGSFFNQLFIDDEQKRMAVLFNEVSRLRSLIIDLVQGETLSREERTIAILVRENWQIDEVIEAGRRFGFSTIQSSTGGDLYQSAPSIDLAALLQALLYGEPEQLSRILHSHFFDVPYNRLKMYELISGVQEDDHSRQKQTDYLIGLIDKYFEATAETGRKEIYRNWLEVQKALRTYPVLQVVRNLYNQLIPWANFGDGDKWKEDFYRMNVELLLEKILQQRGLDNITLHQLTDFMVTNIATRRTEVCRWPDQGEQDIRILCITVHKSKGLEYGAVLLPFTSFPIDKPKRNSMEVMVNSQGEIGYRLSYASNKILKNNNYDLEREIAERMNEETRVLYVAMTRAVRFFSWIEYTSSKAIAWQSLLEGRN